MGNIEEFLHSKASRNKIPLSGTFELSPVCNFSCKMCYVRKTLPQIYAEGKKLRTYEEWIELAKQLKEAGTLYLLLTGGEPFLYPHFKDLYCTLHDMGFIIAINSNGSMIDEETINWLKKRAPYRINITLYGSSKETYGRICQNREGYEKTVHAINKLKEAGIPVIINASMIPENQADLEDIIRFGQERNLNTRVATYMFPPVKRDSEISDSRFTPKESAVMAYRRQCALLRNDKEQIQQYVRRELDKIKTDHNEYEFWGINSDHINCRAGKSSFWISWDGKMTACGMSEFPIVEYPFEKPFKECWDELTNRVREITVLKECKNCKNIEICRPCVAMMTAETGSPDQKAPYLCEMTECLIDILKKESGEK